MQDNEEYECQSASFIHNNSQFAVGSFLTIEFSGYFTCRQTTDPDPTDDPYGTSGYTMALMGEPLLDNVIRLQWSDEHCTLRPSGIADLEQKIKAGIRVSNVYLNGQQDEFRAKKLRGGRVNLVDSPLSDLACDLQNKTVMASPQFISNNNVVGSDDTMAFVIEPFQLEIRSPEQRSDIEPLTIIARDVLDTARPFKRAIEFDQPSAYARRLSDELVTDSSDAHQAIGVFDEYGYFRSRRQWLEQYKYLFMSLEARLHQCIDNLQQENDVSIMQSEVNELKKLMQEQVIRDEFTAYVNREPHLAGMNKLEAFMQSTPSTLATDLQEELTLLLNDLLPFIATEIQNTTSRLFQIEAWGNRVTNKLGFQTKWQHDINCVRQVEVKGGEVSSWLEGEVITDQPWFVEYWFGAWDGDLLAGFMSGRLQIPFKPNNELEC
ncbi:hypothetical protein [uncultured Shewanella sp.]|uniref:hypothetical protein n=1 Tax=uncultured Shewanella sp. TaxID=173975 RepID=UPI00260694B6|nr:hypothetical protein [uncultured Shewanella sp.]